MPKKTKQMFVTTQTETEKPAVSAAAERMRRYRMRKKTKQMLEAAAVKTEKQTTTAEAEEEQLHRIRKDIEQMFETTAANAKEKPAISNVAERMRRYRMRKKAKQMLETTAAVRKDEKAAERMRRYRMRKKIARLLDTAVTNGEKQATSIDRVQMDRVATVATVWSAETIAVSMAVKSMNPADMQRTMITVDDFQFTCRYCLCDCRNVPFFNIHNFTLIQHPLSKFVSVQINKEDRLPKHLCNQCFEDLTNCYKFIDKYKRSEQTFKAVLNKNKIKNEKADT